MEREIVYQWSWTYSVSYPRYLLASVILQMLPIVDEFVMQLRLHHRFPSLAQYVCAVS